MECEAGPDRAGTAPRAYTSRGHLRGSRELPAFRPARQPAGRVPSAALLRWPRLVLPALAVLVGVIVVIIIVAGVWTDYLWFRAVHYSSVFATTYGTRWAMFFVAGLFMALVVGVNAVLAYRFRPGYRPARPPTGPATPTGW